VVRVLVVCARKERSRDNASLLARLIMFSREV
jgi:hypothetical protein